MRTDVTRCLGVREGEACARMTRCARYKALQSESLANPYLSCVDRLCYSGYTFFIEVEDDSRNS